MKVTVINHLTLDGVMQAPGRADEDTRGGFDRGGWSAPYTDEVMGQALGARMERSGGLLFGRRTYEDLLSYWNTQTDSPFTGALNNATKYVASRTLREPLPWVGPRTRSAPRHASRRQGSRRRGSTSPVRYAWPARSPRHCPRPRSSAASAHVGNLVWSCARASWSPSPARAVARS
jgi:hypothetical protein